jgi:cyclophilin family peptidyl-prolyl cis-trans isomerase
MSCPPQAPSPLSRSILRGVLLPACLLLLCATGVLHAQVPTAPTLTGVNPSYVATDTHAYLVRWGDNSSNENYFVVRASLDGTNYSDIAQFAANSTFGRIYINAFPPGTTVYFRVVAVNGSGTSANSNQGSSVVPGTFFNNAPTGLSSSTPATDTLRLNWTDNSNQEDYFSILAQDVAAGGPYQEIARTPFNSITGDYYYYLQRGKTYNIKIRSVWWAGTYGTNASASGDSNVISYTVPGTLISTPPPSPVNLTVAAHSASSQWYYGLYWDDKSTNETGFLIQEKMNSESTWRDLQVVAGDTPGTPTGIGLEYTAHYDSSGTVVPFAADQIFDFRVRATRGNGPFRVLSNDFATVLATKLASFDPPTNVRLSAPLDNGRIEVFWSDNATTELGYEFAYRIGGTGSFTTHPVGQVALNDYSRFQFSGGLGTFPPSTQVEIQVRAYKTITPTSTAWSTPVSITMPPMTPPTGFTATVLNEGSVKFDWTDNSSNEGGYVIQARFLPGGTFFDMTSAAANAQTLTVDLPTLPYPGVSYEFRVAGAYDPGGSLPLIYSIPSGAVSASPPFHPPTGLTATAANETTVNLTWTDNSSVETRYAVLGRLVGATQWSLLGNTAASATSYSATGLLAGTAFEFAVVGEYVRAANDEVETALSNIASASTPLNAPSNLQIQSGSLTETQFTLTWTDNSLVEGGFELLSRPAGSTGAPTSLTLFAANAGSATIPLTPGVSTEFFLRTYFVRTSTPGDVAFSANSAGLTVTARDAMTSAVYVEVVKDALMSPYTLTSTTASAMATRAVTGLPAGLSFDSDTGVISGTPTAAGVVQAVVVITFTNGWTHNNRIAFRVLSPPVVASFPDQSLSIGGSTLSVPLAGKFTDPDASSAVQVATTLGNMTFILFDTATPLTVANFMGYVNRGDYVDTVFHRSPPGFVLQGGGFRVQSAPNNFTRVTTQPAVTNEPGISNIRGTVALAKLGGNPNSGTNQFFVNLGNNGLTGAALDSQNGGFTAFGRVTAPGMVIADLMAARPTGDYNVNIDSVANAFDDFPINDTIAPATMDVTKVLKVTAVTSQPVLTHALQSNSTPAVVTAAISGGNLNLTPVSVGTSTIVVRATDLEGLTRDHTLTVTVNGTYTSWATEKNLPANADEPAEDADGDGSTNLEEFAFLSEPLSGSDLGKPTASQTSGGDPTGRIHFKTRKLAAALTYIVQASESLESNSWVDIWHSATDGYTSPRVTVNQDNADHRVITITDTQTIATGQPMRFLRVRIVYTP